MVRIPKKWQAEEFQPTEVDEAEEQLALEKARFEADTEAEQERERLAKQKPSLGIAKRLREFGMRGTIEARLREAGYEMADLEDEEQQDIVAEIVETSRQEAQRLTDKGFEESAASAKELLRRMREAKDKGVPFREFDPAQELGAEEELKRNQNQYSRSAEAALKRMRRQLAWEAEAKKPSPESELEPSAEVKPAAAPTPSESINDVLAGFGVIPKVETAPVTPAAKETEPPPELKMGGWVYLKSGTGEKIPAQIKELTSTMARVQTEDGRTLNMLRGTLEPAPVEAIAKQTKELDAETEKLLAEQKRLDQENEQKYPKDSYVNTPFGPGKVDNWHNGRVVIDTRDKGLVGLTAESIQTEAELAKQFPPGSRVESSRGLGTVDIIDRGGVQVAWDSGGIEAMNPKDLTLVNEEQSANEDETPTVEIPAKQAPAKPEQPESVQENIEAVECEVKESFASLVEFARGLVTPADSGVEQTNRQLQELKEKSFGARLKAEIAETADDFADLTKNLAELSNAITAFRERTDQLEEGGVEAAKLIKDQLEGTVGRLMQVKDRVENSTIPRVKTAVETAPGFGVSLTDAVELARQSGQTIGELTDNAVRLAGEWSDTLQKAETVVQEKTKTAA